jgi:hypothetical protein
MMMSEECFKVGDVVSDDNGRFWVLDATMGVTGSLCTLVYRATDEALAAFAEHAEFIAENSSCEFFSYRAWSIWTHSHDAAGVAGAFFRRELHPESAKRWLDSLRPLAPGFYKGDTFEVEPVDTYAQHRIREEQAIHHPGELTARQRECRQRHEEEQRAAFGRRYGDGLRADELKSKASPVAPWELPDDWELGHS